VKAGLPMISDTSEHLVENGGGYRTLHQIVRDQLEQVRVSRRDIGIVAISASVGDTHAMREAPHEAAKLALGFFFKCRGLAENLEAVLRAESTVCLAEEMAKTWNGGIADRLLSNGEPGLALVEAPQNIKTCGDATVTHHAGALQSQIQRDGPLSISVDSIDDNLSDAIRPVGTLRVMAWPETQA
jgi:hypothetical protein